MRKCIRKDPSKPVRRVYNECIAINSSDDSDDLAGIPEFSEIRSAMSRKKRDYFPLIPRRVQDVIVKGSWKRNWRGEQFLVHQDPHMGLLIYLSPTFASKLQRCERLFIDGTFKTCPKPFVQLVTIHGQYGNRILPFAFCMLRSKENALYCEMLKQIKTNVHRITGLPLDPESFVCDFEVSLINALHAEFPNSAVRGCYFHFCQSLWRKVQELGLTTAYRQNRSVKKVIRKLMSIGYLPLAVVRNTFNMIDTSQTIRRLIIRHPRLRDFIDYFRMTYIMGNFTPALWNVYDRNVDYRTNNHIEGNVNAEYRPCKTQFQSRVLYHVFCTCTVDHAISCFYYSHKCLRIFCHSDHL
jgi:MULE transposase domain